MEIKIKAYAYTIDIITEIRYFCKCNNAVFGKFRFIFTCAISKTDCSLHHSFHALFKISGNEKFVRTAMETELSGGKKTGFAPYRKENGIGFDHKWILITGKK